ncbi:MAG: phosphoheptose isomerase [Nanoarchaeota archaeon]|nr:phosphoheptose isomerase [Nanoarchaeota archaeon]
MSKIFEEHANLVREVSENFTDKIIEITNVIIDSYKKENKVLTAGNGGSASDAQHIATELVNKLCNKSKALSAIALTADSAVLTAWSNDEGYDKVFERQIDAHGKEGDVLIVITTSGNSVNLIHAVNKAKEKGLVTIGLLGRDGGKLKDLCKYEIIVPGNHVARIQETHEIIYHIICELIEKEFLE